MNQEDILQAAFLVWGREAYKKMSLSDVAQELAVTKPALYRHFRNKEALLEAMKMEIPVVAPEDGTVASIDVAVGDTVEAGAVLATLN